jgi:hypothetical protein
MMRWECIHELLPTHILVFVVTIAWRLGSVDLRHRKNYIPVKDAPYCILNVSISHSLSDDRKKPNSRSPNSNRT